MDQELGGHRTPIHSCNNSEILNIDWRAHWHGGEISRAGPSTLGCSPCAVAWYYGQGGWPWPRVSRLSSILLQSIAPNETNRSAPEIKLWKACVVIFISSYRWICFLHAWSSICNIFFLSLFPSWTRPIKSWQISKFPRHRKNSFVSKSDVSFLVILQMTNDAHLRIIWSS